MTCSDKSSRALDEVLIFFNSQKAYRAPSEARINELQFLLFFWKLKFKIKASKSQSQKRLELRFWNKSFQQLSKHESFSTVGIDFEYVHNSVSICLPIFFYISQCESIDWLLVETINFCCWKILHEWVLPFIENSLKKLINQWTITIRRAKRCCTRFL